MNSTAIVATIRATKYTLMTTNQRGLTWRNRPARMARSPAR